ncbi:stalk domain-containing protein [Chengkuizengella axinellae]|uniref:Stalk domain-containing protein n=1 Tax=Chengkuizengella axinellae TaxID=3064388 RepID=A0ABT9J2R9_9BACL|nr:stalk domain-containing protein [Chengkuizengella sp. 2205SS18-9]MDP5275868.1 stalk domain-containing protein [Chengkuizengella sp. 2205SS18-9]
MKSNHKINGSFFNKKVVPIVVSSFLSVQLLLSPIPGINISEVQAASAKLLSEEVITSGAVLQEYTFTMERDGEYINTDVNVIKLDLNNPYVKLDVMTGVNGQFTERSSVHQMAENSDAVAGVNGDFYAMSSEGAPLGAQVTDGEIYSSPSELVGMFSFGITENNKPVIGQFAFEGFVTAENGESYPLRGVNKTYSWIVPGQTHSHVDSLYVYTSAWGSNERADDGATTPTEVLVVDGIVEEISEGEYLSMTPPENGYILRGHGKAAKYITENMQVGDEIDTEYDLLALSDGGKVSEADDFQMLIGGHTVLIEDGKKADFSRDVSSILGNRSRSAIGYSKDERYVYIVTADHYGESDGLRLSELQQLMLELGIYNGINLDGGGSTTLVSRPLAEFDVELVNNPEYGSQRKVVNGVGVYSTAPEGELKGMFLDGKTTLFINEETTFAMKAYDKYYNPLDVSELEIDWLVSDPIGQFEGNVFIPNQAGALEITASSSQVNESLEIEVVGRHELDRMGIDASTSNMLVEGGTYKLPVSVTTESGVKRTIPAELVDWEFIGFSGAMDGDTLTVHNLENKGIGKIIAKYDGYSSMLTLTAGMLEGWEDFNKEEKPVSFTVYPSFVSGDLSYQRESGDNQSLRLDYDFSEGETVNKAAYAVFNDDEGIEIDGEPQFMKLDLFGDNSYNWVRAEVIDGNGETQKIDISKNVNWEGWETLNVNLAEYNLTYPIKMKRLYIVSPDVGQDEREVTGSISFDNIFFMYKGEIPPIIKPKVEMILNEQLLTVDDSSIELDQAPVLIDGRTMVPLRFIVDALGGQVAWDAADKKVTLIKEDQLIALWINERDINLNGVKVNSDVPPSIINNRTMVPLRFVSEFFGWKVGWDPTTKTITME